MAAFFAAAAAAWAIVEPKNDWFGSMTLLAANALSGGCSLRLFCGVLERDRAGAF